MRVYQRLKIIEDVGLSERYMIFARLMVIVSRRSLEAGFEKRGKNFIYMRETILVSRT